MEMNAIYSTMDDEREEREEPESMEEGQVLRAVEEEIRRSSDMMADDLNSNRERAWAYFEGSEPGMLDDDIEEHFDSVVSRDVADAIEATLAEILPGFAMNRPAQFDSFGGEDEEQAVLESDICNDILMRSGSGFLELMTAAKNALLLRIGALEVIWEDRKTIEYTSVPPQPPEVLAVMESYPGVEIVSVSEDGIDLKRTASDPHCRIEAVPVDELLISSDSASMNLDDARFVGRQTLVSRSDLIADGYASEIVDTLTPYTTVTSTSRSARERNMWGRDKHSGDRSTDMIMVTRCYYRIDEDLDGIAELRYILVAGLPGGWKILEDEPVDYQPFAAGAGYIWPHMPYGISLYDKLRTVQDVKTKFWRIQLEAGQRAARDRAGLLPGTNLKDWATSKFGGGVRMQTERGVVSIPNPRFPTELGQLGAMADKARREGGGGAVDKSDNEQMPVQAGAHGVERMMSAIEQNNAMVAKTLAETLVCQAYLKIHHVLRTYSPPIPYKVKDNWVEVNPREWLERKNLTVPTTLTMSDRMRMVQTYGMLANRQIELLDKGSTLVDRGTLYRTLADQLRMAGVKNVDSYLIDPQSQEGQANARKKEQASQQQQQQAAQQLEAQGRMLVGIEEEKSKGRLQAERIKAQTTMAGIQADLKEVATKLQKDMMSDKQDRQADMEQFNRTLAQQYDKLRVDIAKIEAQYGKDIDEGIASE